MANQMLRMRFVVFLFSVVLLLGLPPLGILLGGHPLAPYLEFPPRTQYVRHAEFSWAVFILIATAIFAVLAPIIVRIVHCTCTAKLAAGRRRPFPWWGWLGLCWTLCAWLLAWTRLEWMTPFQTWTFTPLWMGYLVTMNAVTWMRSGRSLLIQRPGAFAALFPISAIVWWYFEYLNRFVQNWHYDGAGDLSQADYILQATIPFSTVLPAVVSTYEFLATFPRLSCGLDRGPAFTMRHRARWAWVLLLLAGVVLMGLGLWPNMLFQLVWIAPLLVIVCVQGLWGHPTIFAPLVHGDWRSIWNAALAALICGFFWELWNWQSLAHWSYTIPYVDRFHLFAMPLLGYAGYLPFGLECLAVAELVLNDGERGS
jgi:hypothetical protein